MEAGAAFTGESACDEAMGSATASRHAHRAITAEVRQRNFEVAAPVDIPLALLTPLASVKKK